MRDVQPQILVFLTVVTIVLSRSPKDALKGCTAPFFLPNLPYLVVWDTPSGSCSRQGIDLNLTAYGIVTNNPEGFQGGNMTIFYNIGAWPVINRKTHEMVNGGLPQTGDLHNHLLQETQIVKSTIKSADFNGLSVIDFEAWRPHLPWNFDALLRYQTKSRELVKKEHPTWNNSMVNTEAILQFDRAARAYFESTLQLAKQLRPMGYWGYYGYPRCWGISKSNVCPSGTPNANDKYLSWMFSQSTAFYPRIYTNKGTPLPTRHLEVRQIVNETLRVQVKWSSLNTPVMPYTRIEDSATDLFNKDDLRVALEEPADMGASGVAIWGSSSFFHTHTYAQCQKLRDDIKNVVGPFVKNLTDFAQACSLQLCNNHGRCVSKEYEAQTQKFLALKQTTSCFRPTHEYQDISSRRVLQFGENLYKNVRKYDYYICRCLAGYHGEYCDKTL